MLTSNRRWIPGAALALLVLAQAASAHAMPASHDAAARRTATPVSSCRAAARRLIARAALVRRINGWIAVLLNARRYRQAAEALRRAAQRHGDAWAGYALGGLYAAGLGVPRSAPSAFRWYLWSARRGSRFAERQVANAYLQGEGTRRNSASAAYWLRMAVAPWQLAGSDYELAQTYARGHLAPVNQRKAAYYTGKSLALLRALARERNAEADYFLGLDYAFGHGVPRERAKAAGALCRAVALGYTPAAALLRHLEARPQ